VRHARIYLAGAVLVLAGAALAWNWSRLRGGANLTVILRCSDVEAGVITLSMLDELGRSARERDFDVSAVCAEGRLTLDGYQSPRSVRIRLRGNSGEAQLASEPGEDIQAERRGYFLVVRLTGRPPTLANDTL